MNYHGAGSSDQAPSLGVFTLLPILPGNLQALLDGETKTAPKMATEGVILLADRDAKAACMMGVALRQLGMPYRLVRVPNGQEVIRYLQGEGRYANLEEFPLPELLLLDLEIKRVDAVSVLRWIRQSPKARVLQVIVLGNPWFDSRITQAYAAGANSFLIKCHDHPAILDQLRQIKEQWLGKATK